MGFRFGFTGIVFAFLAFLALIYFDKIVLGLVLGLLLVLLIIHWIDEVNVQG